MKRTRIKIVFSFLSLLIASSSYAGKSVVGVTESAKDHDAITLKGMVVDVMGNPIIGASIIEVGRATNGTISDVNGSFTLKLKPNSVIKVTSLGYSEKSVRIQWESQLRIELEEDIRRLDEVVVIAYGSQRKSDLTGAIATVRSEDLLKAPVPTLDQSLAGRIAGVQVSSDDGQPGSTANVVIRGGNSLTQSNAPLYVVDGFPVESIDDIRLNPNDIEFMTVLKDASSTAIYGARGANGVIVIETKQHKGSEKMFVNYDIYVGVRSVTKRLDMMEPYDFVKYQQEVNSVFTDQIYLFSGRTLDDYKNISGINWQDQLFRDGLYHNHNLTLKGGNKTRYNVTLSYLNQQGPVINTGYKKHQGRLNLNHDTNNANYYLGISYANDNAYGDVASDPSSTVYNSYLLFRTWAYRPVKGRGDGDLLSEVMDPESATASTNPIIDVQNVQRANKVENILLNSFANFKLMKNLEFKVRGGFTSKNTREEGFFNSLTSRGSSFIPSNTRGVNAFINNIQFRSVLNENTLTYKYRRGKRSFTGLLGGTYQYNTITRFGFTAEQIPNESLALSGMDQGTPGQNNTLISDSKLLSFLGRIDYNYADKYLLTGTMRADASSKFSVGNRWGYFPSAAFAWRITQEPFMRNIRFISDAKIRTSYGITGNNRIGDYSRFSQLTMPTSSYYSFGNQPPSIGLNVSSFGNNDLKWETTHQFNIGTDIYLFNGKVNVIVDYYYKLTNDLLLNTNVPYATGHPTIYKNIGSTSNEGIELTINTVNVKNKNFSWETNFNIAFNKNKILSLTDGETKLKSIMPWSTNYNKVDLYIAEVGKSPGMFYGLMWDGVYQLDDFDKIGDTYVLKPEIPTNGNSRSSIQPGDIKYRDVNDDGIISVKDNVVIGRGLPIHIGGFNNEFKYKNITLSMFFQWSYGNNIMNANRIYLEGNVNNSVGMNQLKTYNNRWTPENPNTDMYRVGGQGPSGYYSNRTLEDGSYLRLKIVRLSYRLPSKVTQKIFIKSINIYASAQNLFTWTNYTGMDPEVSLRNTALTPGFDFSTYPQSRTIVMGINIDL